MTTPDQAQALFLQGYACSQSILATFADRYSLGKREALRVAAAFGGGIARSGQMCGAVSGALMVLGLAYASLDAEDKAAKEHLYALGQEFIARFKARCGTIECRSLLGMDISHPEQLQLAREQGVFESRCPNFVGGAVEILEEMLSR